MQKTTKGLVELTVAARLGWGPQLPKLGLVLCVVLLLAGCGSTSTDHEEPVEDVQGAVIPAPSSALALIADRVTTESGKLVASTALTLRTFVTAMKLSNGTLKVILWRLNVDDTLERLDSEIDATQVGDKIAIARIDEERFVVAEQMATGALRVIAWKAVDNNVEKRDEVHTSSITDLAVTAMNTAPGRVVEGVFNTLTTTDFVVATRLSCQCADNGRLQLRNYTMDGLGNLSIRTLTTGPGIGSPIHLARVPGPKRTIVTGGQEAGFTLRSWDVANDGVTTARGQATGSVNGHAMVPQSFRRVATVESTIGAGTNPTTRLTAKIWDIDRSTGAIALHSSTQVALTTDTIANVQLAQSGGTRLFLAFGRASIGGVVGGTLVSLEALDTLRWVEAKSLPGTFWVQPGSIVAIGESHPILSWINNSQVVSVRAYRDYNIPLLRGDFDRTGNLLTGTPSAVSLPVDVGSSSNDLTLAVGHNFVMACAARVTFHDRTGAPLPIKYDHPAASESYTAGQILYSVIDLSSPSSISRHLSYQYACDPDHPNGVTDSNECINQRYDTRCAYDWLHRRFVLTSNLRYDIDTNRDNKQRYVAIAVSKTEDPRDGFRIFASGEQWPGDNPSIAITDGKLIITHAYTFPAFNNDDPNYAIDNGDVTLTPAAYVLHVNALSTNAHDPLLTKITRTQTANKVNLRPVQAPDSKVAFLRDIKLTARLSLSAFMSLNWGPIPVTPLTANFAAPINGDEDNQPSLWLGPAVVGADGVTRRSGRVYVATATSPSGSCNRDIAGNGGSSANGNCDPRLSTFPIQVNVTQDNNFNVTLSPSDGDVTVPCPGRTASTFMNCARVSVAANATQAVMAFRRLEYDPATNSATGLPLEWRTVRFHPSTLGFLDSAISGDRSRLVVAGSGAVKPNEGFKQSHADPVSNSIWSIGEASVSSAPHAFITKTP